MGSERNQGMTERRSGEGLAARRASRGDILRAAAERLREAPQAGDPLFLLAYGVERGDRSALARAEEALGQLTRGWEGASLRDQALLAWACLEANRCTGQLLYGETGRRIVEFLLERRRLPGGGFAGDGAAAVAAENGLVIGALALAFRELGEQRYLRAAETARIFLKTRLTTPEGALHRFWRNRAVSGQGTPEDYGGCLLGLLELYGAGFFAPCLRQAAALGGPAAALLRSGTRGETAGACQGESLFRKLGCFSPRRNRTAPVRKCGDRKILCGGLYCQRLT